MFERLTQTEPSYYGKPAYEFEARLVELAARLATPALVPQLLQVAGDGDRCDSIRVVALRGLTRLHRAVPAAALCRLIEGAVATARPDHHEIFELLRIADTLDDTMLAVLDACSSRMRYDLLRWSESAGATGERPTRAVHQALRQRWARDAGLATADDDTAHPEFAVHDRHPIDGDPAALRDQLGLAPLLSLVRQQIIAASLYDRCPLLDPGWQYGAACDVLRELPEARGELARLLGRAALSPRVHGDLLEIALEVDRAATLAHVARLPRMWRRIARVVAASPLPADRAFAEAAARSDDDATAYWAIAALDQLGAPPDSLPAAELPRVRALWARARRGDHRAVAALVEAATAPATMVRAEAVRWLGQLDDARDHAAVFERCLSDQAPCELASCSFHAPVADQAALALDRLGGARTLLLRAYFVAYGGTSAVIRDLLCDDDDDDGDDRCAIRLATKWSPFPREADELD